MTSKSVENLIREARERGEFDNLRGRGKPLDHSGYFSQPEEARLANHLLQNAGFVPEWVELRRELGELQARWKASSDDDERAALMRQIAHLAVKLDLQAR